MSTLISTHTAQYAVLAADLVGRGEMPIGVLLHDAASDALYVRLRRDLENIADEEEFEILNLLEEDLNAKARELGAGNLLEWLEENASLSIRVAGRESVLVEDFPRAVNRLYRQHVQSEVRQFQTHLPRYSLQVAAGKFLENEEVTEQGWEEAPRDLRIVPDMFVAQIVGHSMEPLIPDGALCVFRAGVTGSRSGRLVLVEDLETGGNNRYTVKRYKSEKSSADGEWKHTRIRLESLNPDYPSWDLLPDEEKYRIIAEFVSVLD